MRENPCRDSGRSGMAVGLQLAASHGRVMGRLTRSNRLTTPGPLPRCHYTPAAADAGLIRATSGKDQV